MRARTDKAKQLKRDTLLFAALEEFYERGFSAARIEDIASRAHVSKGTLYLYFQSKEDLFYGLVDQLTTPRLQALERIDEQAHTLPDALTQFFALTAEMIESSPMHKLMKILIGDSQQFPNVLKVYRENVINRVLKSVNQMLASAHQRGEIKHFKPDQTARLVIAPVILSNIWKILFVADFESNYNVGALLKEHQSRLLHGLLGPQ